MLLDALAKAEMTIRLQQKLRNLFDQSLSVSGSNACIEIAIELNWIDLATEMQSDLQFEETKQDWGPNPSD